jgi:hypothetical protein
MGSPWARKAILLSITHLGEGLICTAAARVFWLNAVGINLTVIYADMEENPRLELERETQIKDQMLASQRM